MSRFVVPGSLDEAIGALTGGDARAIAGGVTIAGSAGRMPDTPVRLVSLARLRELRGVRRDGDRLRLGATTTHAELAADRALRAGLPAVATMFGRIGNARIRAWGTVGGNLALPVPAHDPPVLLAALGAEIATRGPDGVRKVTVSEASALRPGEVITDVALPTLGEGERCRYRTIATGSAADTPVARAAVVARLHDRRLAAISLVCGTATTAPLDCGPLVEGFLGAEVSDEYVLDAIAVAVRDAVTPFDGRLGSADYQRMMAGVCARRVVRDLTADRGLAGE